MNLCAKVNWTPSPHKCVVTEENKIKKKKFIICVLAMFVSPYTRESIFSLMTSIKIGNRALGTNEHLCHCLQTAPSLCVNIIFLP